MAVEDVKRGNEVKAQAISAPARVVTLSSLPTASKKLKTETDTIHLDNPSARTPLSQHQLRSRVNKAIEAANVASGAVEEIARILGGIEGIVEQVNSNEIPGPRLAKLEREARGLRDEISRVAQVSTSDGLKPLAGDSIRLELEETLGKALEIILPDDAKDAFGLASINLSQKELILDTATKVEKARRGIEELRGTLESGINHIRTTVAALEVATQNAEASQTSVRDVDAALRLAADTRGEIREDPAVALGSVGDISKNAKGLLDNA